jgi:sugar lactone lactonase YvrE
MSCLRSFASWFAGLLFITLIGTANADILVDNGNDGTVSRINGAGIQVGSFNTGLAFPTGIAVDQFGRIYVGDGGGSSPTITRYSPFGTNQGVFATIPHALWTGAVAIDNSGVLWTGGWDTGDGSLYRFDSTGAPLGPFGNVFYHDFVHDFGFGGASYFGVAFQSNGDVVAVDDFFEGIYRFGPDGTLLSLQRTGSFFDRSTPFDPFSVAVDSHDNIFVGGTGNGGGEIREYSNTGIYVKTLVSDLGGVFGTVAGLAFGPDGNLYATEYDSGVIERFSPDGADLGVFASGLNGPVGIVVSSVPEPATFLVCGISLAALAIVNRFRRRAIRKSVAVV